jgi:hypothetical protein
MSSRISLSRKSKVKDIQKVKESLENYLKKYVIFYNNTNNFYLSKPNIKILCLFILSTIKLNDDYKQKLYQVILKNNNLDTEQIKIIYKLLSNVIGANKMYPIIYDQKIVSISDFILINNITILCSYNGNEKSPDIYFNVTKILSDIFDNNCDIIEFFRKDYKLFENVFIEGQDILAYVNDMQYEPSNKSSNSSNSRALKYSRNSSRSSGSSSSSRSFR